MDLMLDTNIILDHIDRREPFYEMSRRTCLLGITGEANTYITVNMLSDIYYLLCRDFDTATAQDMIENDLAFLQLVGITPDDAHYALSQHWNDFEDCLVARGAEKIRATYIITRNVDDFAASTVEAITPDELFRRLEAQGFVYSEEVWH